MILVYLEIILDTSPKYEWKGTGHNYKGNDENIWKI